MHHPLTKPLLLACAALLLGAAVAGAGAYTLPVSTQLVKGEIEAVDGRTIRFAVLDGGMYKIREADEYFLGITPRILDAESGRVAVKVFEIKEHGPGLESLKFISETEVRVAEKNTLEGAVSVQLTILGLSESSMSEKELAAMRQAADPTRAMFEEGAADTGGTENAAGSQCCLTCGSTTSYGCAVSDSCGSCCVPPCCGDGGGPLQDTP